MQQQPEREKRADGSVDLGRRVERGRRGWRARLPARSGVWGGVSREDRRRIAKAIRNEQLLHDPREATLLLEVTPKLRRLYSRARRWPFLLARLWIIGWLAWELFAAMSTTRGSVPAISLVLAALWLSSDIYGLASTRKRARKLDAADARHRHYLIESGHALPAVNEEPAIARNWHALLAAPVVTVSFLLLAVALLLPSSHPSHAELLLFAFLLLAATAVAVVGARLALLGWRRAAQLHTARRLAGFGLAYGVAVALFLFGETIAVLVLNW